MNARPDPIHSRGLAVVVECPHCTADVELTDLHTLTCAACGISVAITDPVPGRTARPTSILEAKRAA